MKKHSLWTENEWELAADGIPTRYAARVIIISEDGHTFLMRGHDRHDPTYSWWFTVGGGIDAGETPAAAAVREMWEETGVQISETDLIGPVVKRVGKFEFTDRVRRQIEYIYLVYAPRFNTDKQGWTRTENELIDEVKWVPINGLPQLSETGLIFPAELKTIIPGIYSNGWDGSCVKIDEYTE